MRSVGNRGRGMALLALVGALAVSGPVLAESEPLLTVRSLREVPMAASGQTFLVDARVRRGTEGLMIMDAGCVAPCRDILALEVPADAARARSFQRLSNRLPMDRSYANLRAFVTLNFVRVPKGRVEAPGEGRYRVSSVNLGRIVSVRVIDER